MLSAICFNLDQCNILSSGYRLIRDTKTGRERDRQTQGQVEREAFDNH